MFSVAFAMRTSHVTIPRCGRTRFDLALLLHLTSGPQSLLTGGRGE